MTSKTYSVIGNRTAADVVAGREETIETGYDLESAKIAAIELQKIGEFIAAWVEEEETPASSLDTLKFALIVVDAKSKTNNPRWLRAIDRAAEGILSGELIVTTLRDGALVTSPNGTYMANGTCGCKAFKYGHRECRHRAAGRLMEIYESAPASVPAPRSIPSRNIASAAPANVFASHAVCSFTGFSAVSFSILMISLPVVWLSFFS